MRAVEGDVVGVVLPPFYYAGIQWDFPKGAEADMGVVGFFFQSGGQCPLAKVTEVCAVGADFLYSYGESGSAIGEMMVSTAQLAGVCLRALPLYFVGRSGPLALPRLAACAFVARAADWGSVRVWSKFARLHRRSWRGFAPLPDCLCRLSVVAWL